LPLGKLQIWEVATWEKSFGKVPHIGKKRVGRRRVGRRRIERRGLKGGGLKGGGSEKVN